MKKQYAPFLLLLALLTCFNVYSLPKLSSWPTATATIYLDFDGENINNAYWNGGTPFTCAPAGFTDAQITEVYNRVAEDYRPFNINITTDLAVFTAAPLSSRMRVVITPTSSWFQQQVGGVSFTGSFKWGDDTPAFVFCDKLGPNNSKWVAECCSHESGHTVGLSHQSKYDGTCNLTATYNDGLGSGVASWAPIMGNSYYRNMTGWNNGPTPYGCANKQDNLSIITSQNGFTYRVDDYSDDISSNPQQIILDGSTTDGVITTTTDLDAFKIGITANAVAHINIKPYSINTSNLDGANLDVKVMLYNASKVLVRTYDPQTSMEVVIDTVLNTGTYYLVVDGTGNSNIDDYGSLGSYQVSGTVGGVLPIKNIALEGKVENSKHNLSWSIVADEPVKFAGIEYSTDGIHFSGLFATTVSSKSFSYTPTLQSDLYYRIKATVASGQSMYSNIVMLKATGKKSKAFNVSTFVRQEISITTDANYAYQLSDANGNILSRGKATAGISKVEMNRYPAGMYIIQLVNNTQTQTERIIKQ